MQSQGQKTYQKRLNLIDGSEPGDRVCTQSADSDAQMQ